MRRSGRVLAWALGSIAALAVLFIAVVMVAGNTQVGREMIERVVYRLTSGQVELVGLGGTFPTDLHLTQLQLIDRDGVWLRAERISVRWSPWSLIERRIAVDDLDVARLDMERLPLAGHSSGGAPYIPHVDVQKFSIEVLQLGAALAGTPATLSARGGGRLRSLEDAGADAVVHRVDGSGEYTLHFKFDRRRMDGTLEVEEPASGPLENILHLPGLGALSAKFRIEGPRNAERVELTLRADGLSAHLAGSVDLPGAAAELGYSLESSPLRPRPDLSWQHIDLKGHWRGTFSKPSAEAHLLVRQLELPGGTAIAALKADLAGSAGSLTLQGVLDGLRIAGPEPNLFVDDPLEFEASLRLNDPRRPLLVSAAHRLLSLKAQAVTRAPQSATVDLRFPDVMPFAALAGQDVHGDATMKVQIGRRGAGLDFNLDADAGITGGTAVWVPYVGDRVALKSAGSMTPDAFTVDRAQLSGHAWTLSASANAARPSDAGAGQPGAAPPGSGGAQPRALALDYIKQLKAQWDLHVPDLRSVVPELAGELQASGEVSGAPTALTADATARSSVSIRGSAPGTVTAELHARGLPSAPSAAVNVGGTLDGSPLDLSISLERGARRGARAVVRRGTWKSARLEGDVAIETGIADSRGQIRLLVTQLADFDRLVGADLLGSVEGNVTFTPKSGRTHAQFDLQGRDLKVGQISGTLQVKGEGATNSVAAELLAQSPDLSGSPASVAASAELNLESRELRLSSASADYRGQDLRLLAPALLSYGNGLKIDQLKFGVQGAVLEIAGELSPGLDLRASLEHVDPKLLNVFLPDAVAEGSIQGQARLQGSLSAPTGRVSLTVHGLRSALDEAVGLPALDVDAGADLNGDTAAIDVRLSAGSASSVNVTGTAPLNAAGTFDLKMKGKMEIGVVNPFFEARGMHVGGSLAVDATLGGKRDAPQIIGSITIAEANLRDYARGFNVTHINAEVSGSEGTLQIKEFKATAAPGSVAMTGSIGLLQPGIPVDLAITATNAQAITSNIITANVNADLEVRGTAREHLDVAGSIHVNRATIGIPDSLPPDVAVLDVRRRGKPAPVPGKRVQIGFDVAIQAPRQVLVQGRGLDAELGGDLHITGTAAAPLVGGRFDLQRGDFTIGSTKLTFNSSSNLSFNGTGLKKNIDPTLDFTATTTVQSTTAGSVQITLAITGYADSPQFALSSNTNAPQDEILSLLLFGESAAQLSALQAAQMAATLATLTGVGGSGANPLIKLQKTLGLDRLNVGANTTTTATGATQDSGAAIQAGRYIFKRVYVEGRQTSTGQSQVAVDVDLTKHLKLQTRLGNGTAIQGTTPENDPGSSVGLSYQFEY
jgi:translocation and assembly module TamB